MREHPVENIRPDIPIKAKRDYLAASGAVLPCSLV